MHGSPPARPRARALAGAVAALLAGVAIGWLAAPLVHDAAPAAARAAGAAMFSGYAGQRWAELPATTSLPATALLPDAQSSSDDARADLALEQLARLGYAAGKSAAGGPVGVTVHRRGEAHPGRNLCHFGHEPAALLLDMEGRTLHRWSLDLRAATGRVPHHDHWRRVHVLDDGDLLAIYEGQFLVRLDRDSRLRWCFDGGAHHDVDVDRDGAIHVLTRAARRIPRIDLHAPCLEDFIAVLDPGGREIARVSLLEALERSAFAPLLTRAPPHGDLTHANTLEVLDGRWAHRAPAFAAGNVLVSLRELDAVVVVDLAAARVVWALAGLWDAQHQPTLLDDGHLLVFDNRGHFGLSRVIELDPLTQQVAWRYDGNESNGFFSAECGAAQRLPGGTTLVTETDTGRAFEVTPDGRIVWEYRSPYRAGPRGRYVASLFEMIRLPADFGDAWLGGGAPDGAR